MCRFQGLFLAQFDNEKGGRSAATLVSESPAHWGFRRVIATEIDRLHGNAGNDLLVSKDGQVDDLFGDGGHDTSTSDSEDLLTSVEEPV
jgi:hypothetical protein